jgi:predicted phosphodiesterase
MRIIVLTDLHANLPALEAVLEAIEQGGYDEIVHMGDAIGIGPYPEECLERLLDTPKVSLVMGNHDAWLVDGFPSSPPEWVDREDEFARQMWTHVQNSSRWTRTRVSRRLSAFVAEWPFQITREFEGVQAAFQHYALESSGRGFKPLVIDPTVDAMDRLFAAHGSDILFYGHNHAFSDLTGRARYVNPGSLGLHSENSARYCVAEFRNGKCTLAYHSAAYDDRELFQAFERREVPGRQFFYEVFLGGRFG